MENIIVSACLLGVDCRYDGRNTYKEKIENLKNEYNIIPVCPEILGGLQTPRDPAEIIDDRVISSSGKDVTKEYKKGAEEALKLAKMFNCKKAVLKAKSPSCGKGLIYDGTFSGNKIKGDGITVRMFEKAGIEVVTEDEI